LTCPALEEPARHLDEVFSLDIAVFFERNEKLQKKAQL
jgi:hypothetical protein